MTQDGTIRGTRVHGDDTCKKPVKTKDWYNGPDIYECMGCRKPLKYRSDDERVEEEMWAAFCEAAEEIVAEHEKKRQRSE